ncbi:MAG: hypothetical protein ACK53Y_04535, partial [bacterium]
FHDTILFQSVGPCNNIDYFSRLLCYYQDIININKDVFVVTCTSGGNTVDQSSPSFPNTFAIQTTGSAYDALKPISCNVPAK